MKVLVLPADGTLAARRNARTFGTAPSAAPLSSYRKVPQLGERVQEPTTTACALPRSLGPLSEVPRTTDAVAIVKELIPHDRHLHHWLDMAKARIRFQGLPARTLPMMTPNASRDLDLR
jgi:hypothetical protein